MPSVGLGPHWRSKALHVGSWSNMSMVATIFSAFQCLCCPAVIFQEQIALVRERLTAAVKEECDRRDAVWAYRKQCPNVNFKLTLEGNSEVGPCPCPSPAFVAPLEWNQSMVSPSGTSRIAAVHHHCACIARLSVCGLCGFGFSKLLDAEYSGAAQGDESSSSQMWNQGMQQHLR